MVGAAATAVAVSATCSYAKKKAWLGHLVLLSPGYQTHCGSVPRVPRYLGTSTDEPPNACITSFSYQLSHTYKHKPKTDEKQMTISGSCPTPIDMHAAVHREYSVHGVRGARVGVNP